MSYQVLARKWRPRFFDEMVGQEHVLRALINALNQQKLHHAYLFTGTRGVGKTTIARILAKCLNCEQGVSARPCGQCSACQEIAQGRFVDLIEVDAASRTKVEDTRELLDNVQYAPTRGRFKVYLIDEVHMLSSHSFNALLKTLEEPPAHVKFLLATTDPQKLPVTVLSRCLQFNLKNMPASHIVQHLEKVLTAEAVAFEEPALWQIGRAAQGSMRDALSLTDQAIAYGEGQVYEAPVNAMLGTLDRGRLFKLAECLAKADASAVLSLVATMAEHSVDYDEVLQGLLAIFHRSALAQLVPDAIDDSEGDRQAILALAQAMSAEDLQLYYQIGVSGRKDLSLAPEARQGFEMLVLRMLAFRPALSAPLDLDLPSALEKKKPLAPNRATEFFVSPVVIEQASVLEAPPASTEQTPHRDAFAKPETPTPEQSTELFHEAVQAEPIVEALSAGEPIVLHNEPVAAEQAVAVALDAPSIPAASAEADTLSPENWWQWLARLPLAGLTQAIARASALDLVDGHWYEFSVDPSQSFLFNDSHQERLQEALSDVIAGAKVRMILREPRHETPAQREERLQFTAHYEAKQALEGDALVLRLMDEFDAHIIEGSVAPTPLKEERQC